MVCYLKEDTMSIATQFYLLQYKNWKLQFRRKLVTVFEILLPALFCLLTVSLRTLVEVDEFKEPIHYPSYSVDYMPPDLIKSMNPYNRVIGLAYTPKTLTTETLMGKVCGKLINLDTGPIWVQRMYSSDVIPSSTTYFLLIFSYFLCISVQGFDTEDEIVQYLAADNGSSMATREQYYLGGVVFDQPELYQNGSMPYNISYTIRLLSLYDAVNPCLAICNCFIYWLILCYSPRYSPRNFTFSIRLLNSWYTDYLFAPFLEPWPRDNNSMFDSKPGKSLTIAYLFSFLAILSAV